MSQSFTRPPGQAPADAAYVTNTPNANLTAEQALSLLASGYMKVTTGTGIVSSQAVPIPIADGGTNQTAFTTNGVVFFNGTALTSTAAGTSTQVLHGGSPPSFSAVSLTSDVTGVLPIANGGTNNAGPFTAGSVIFHDGTRFQQDNANFFWDDSTNQLLFGGTSAAAADIILSADGSATFNEQGNATGSFRVESDAFINMFVVDYAANRVDIGNATQGAIASFSSTAIVFNETAANLDFRVEGQTQPNLLFTDASTDRIGVRTNAPHSTLDVRGGISLAWAEKTASYVLTGDDFGIGGNPGAGVDINIDLPPASEGNRIFFVKKLNAAVTDTVTIRRNGADTIDGAAADTVLTVQFSWRMLQSDGVSNWIVISTG